MKTLRAALLAASWLLLPVGAQAQEASGDTQERISTLERELALLKRQLEVQEEAAASRGPQPVIGAGPDGFFLRSPDSKYQLRLRGYTHFDSRWFSNADDVGTTDSYYFRRVRPQFEGTLAGFLDFRIMPDCANSTLVLQDAWANMRFAPAAQLQFGKFKSPVGLERLQSANALTFIERALPTLLVPNRDLGVMFQGDVGEGLLSYQFAALNGSSDAGSNDADVGDDKDLVGRLFVHPFQRTTLEPLQGLGIGFATTYGRPQGSPGTIRNISGQTLFQFVSGTTFQGERARYSPQAYWYWGPFSLLSEYVSSAQRYENTSGNVRAKATSWQVAGSWVITGENTSFRGVLPSKSFNLETGELGAFEVAARYSRLSLDSELFDGDAFIDGALYPEDTREWALGLNWYLNRFVRVMFNYEHADFDNASGNPDNPSEGVFLTRLQLAY